MKVQRVKTENLPPMYHIQTLTQEHLDLQLFESKLKLPSKSDKTWHQENLVQCYLLKPPSEAELGFWICGSVHLMGSGPRLANADLSMLNSNIQKSLSAIQAIEINA